MGIAKTKSKLDSIFSQYIRLRGSNDEGWGDRLRRPDGQSPVVVRQVSPGAGDELVPRRSPHCPDHVRVLHPIWDDHLVDHSVSRPVELFAGLGQAGTGRQGDQGKQANGRHS